MQYILSGFCAGLFVWVLTYLMNRAFLFIKSLFG